jgi:predicted GNAT superfamily acetyltransferase
MSSGKSFPLQPADSRHRSHKSWRGTTPPARVSAWELARAAARGAGVELRPLPGVDDADLINGVIQATWGGQRIDREVIRALAASGNVCWGAFDGSDLIGFVLGWAGVNEDGLHVHSHMLAAVPDRRHRGVGYALKLAQRAQALGQQIHVVRWTFDPLLARNAWLNLGKLGAVADGFTRDYYGAMTDDLNLGERSDRLMVRWDLVREPGPRSITGPSTQIPIPIDHQDLRTRDPEEARRWRDDVAARVERAMAAGEIGVAFDRDRSCYLFAKEDAAG